VGKNVEKDDYQKLCLSCPLPDCRESDPRCPIQIEVQRENEKAGEEIKKFTPLRKRQANKETRANDPDNQTIKALNCRGCGEKPIEVGNFGRYKYACPLTVAHSPKTKRECIHPHSYPSRRSQSEAISMWNNMQAEQRQP